MKLLIGEDENVARYVATLIPHMRRGFGERMRNGALPYVAFGVVDESDEPVGGVVFHNYAATCRSIELSAASGRKNWLNRNIINDMMNFPFKQLGCVRVTTITPRRNLRAREFDVKLGFRQEGLVRRGFGDDDAIIYGMLASEWRRSPFNLEAAKAVESVS